MAKVVLIREKTFLTLSKVKSLKAKVVLIRSFPATFLWFSVVDWGKRLF